jgi:pimeloyl-ACP methyl ester carboxylesterase
VEVPDVQYAKSGDVNIAYQATGEGPFDLVFVPGYVTHLELHWAMPSFAPFLERLSSFCRLIRFDKRGTGMSDRISGAPTLETRMDDVRAVMDAVGSRRAAFYGVSEGAAMSILFAATYPERMAALIVRSAFPRRMWAPDYPWGVPRRSASARSSAICVSSAPVIRRERRSALSADSPTPRWNPSCRCCGSAQAQGRSRRSTG